MTRISKLLCATALIAAGAVGQANANVVLSFAIATSATVAVDTTNITAGTATQSFTYKTSNAATAFVVSGTPTSTPSSVVTNLAMTGGDTVTITGGTIAGAYTTITIPTVVGGFTAFDLTVDGLDFQFTSVSSVNLTASGANSPGYINEALLGTVINSASQGFDGASVSLSESCNQTKIGSQITCSFVLDTPAVINNVPEPVTMSLFGLGVVGLAAARRRSFGAI